MQFFLWIDNKGFVKLISLHNVTSTTLLYP